VINAAAHADEVTATAARCMRIVFITRGIAREEVLALWEAGRAAA
jgi:hypothetical protein